MRKVSVIMPYVNEWPQIAFTIRAVHEQLIGYEHEIVVIDNWCPEVERQGAIPDRGHAHFIQKGTKKNLGFYNAEGWQGYATKNIGHMEAMAGIHSWLKYVRYDKKLSHWNAKNQGVLASDGDVLLFLDSHVMPSKNLLHSALLNYRENIAHREKGLNTLHLPLSYHILEDKRLIYKFIYEPDNGNLHYRFCSMIPKVESFVLEVPCMSTCGMFMPRVLFDILGGWPEGFGIYGGGENYINFVMAVIGAKKFIHPFGTLHHHGDRRDYSWNWTDYHTNRMIAMYMAGGEVLLNKYRDNLGAGADRRNINKMAERAKKYGDQHISRIEEHRCNDIIDWAESWCHLTAIEWQERGLVKHE